MDNGNQTLTADGISVDETADQFDDARDTTAAPNENGFARIAIGILIGATLGGIVGALTNRGAVDRVNQTVKKVGDSVKGAAASVSETVKEVGNAVNSVAVGVNETVRDVGGTVRGAADDVTDTVETTASTVRATTDDVNDEVKTTLNAVQNTVTTIQRSSNLRPAEQAKPAEQIVEAAATEETLYRLVPVAPDTTAK